MIPIKAASAKPKKISQSERIRMVYELKKRGIPETEIARKTGFATVPTKTLVSPLSVNTDATVPNPYVYHDTVNNKYVAYADFEWNNYRTLGDGSYSTGNVGGYEALSIRFSTDVIQDSTPSGTIYWGGWTGAEPWPDFNMSGPLFPGLWDNSEEGASLQWQDKTHALHCGGTDYPSCAQYNSGHGYLAYAFRPPTQCTQIFAQYAHTWGSTSISGVTVSNGGFEVNFTSAEKRWQRTSGATLIAC